MDSNATFVTVHKAAEILGVSPDTIRRWEKKGLVRAKRSKKNYRLFSVDQLRALDSTPGKRKSRKFVIHKAKATNFTTIELFAGAGGLALGLENAGLRHVLLNEIDSDCVDTLAQNRPSWNVVHSDIGTIDFKQYRGLIDVVTGGFPCQAFSYAGHGRGFDDARGTLFYEFARCIREVEPRIAVAENVRGLLNHDGGKTVTTMRRILDNLGYFTALKLLRGQFFDVAQKRERIMILAVKKDFSNEAFFPLEKDYVWSLRDALKGCPSSDGYKYSTRKKVIMDLIPEGGYWRDLTPELQREYMKGSFHLSGGRTGMARRLSWDEPSLTLTCNPAQKQTERCHPSETRPLNCAEYSRIQAFPFDWKFSGSLSSRYKQIGNAVPVNLAYFIGRSVIKTLGHQVEDVACQPVNLEALGQEMLF